MATYTKYDIFVQHLADKVHDFFGINDVFKCALSNTAPVVGTHTVFADFTEIAAGNGYTAGGEDSQNNSTRTGGTLTETAVDIVWTASGAVGPFRYVGRYNDTPTAPADPLINYWDYGSSPTLASGETFTVDFGASVSTLT